MAYRTIKAFNATCVDCKTREDSRPMLWDRQPGGRELVDHGSEWVYALVPHCQSCYVKARGGKPDSIAVLQARRDAAARAPFEKRLDLDLDPLD